MSNCSKQIPMYSQNQSNASVPLSQGLPSSDKVMTIDPEFLKSKIGNKKAAVQLLDQEADYYMHPPHLSNFRYYKSIWSGLKKVSLNFDPILSNLLFYQCLTHDQVVKKKITGVRGLTIIKMRSFMSTNGLLPYLPDAHMCSAYDLQYMVNVSMLFLSVF